jgi:histidinol-phosphatase (PHP family)
LCKHASGEIREYVESAIASGLKEIAFTDHIPLPGNFDSEHRMHENEIDIYERWVYEMRRAYPEISIRFGIEADYIEGFEEYLDRFLTRHNFDIVIMSIHFIRKWPPGNWVFNYSFPDKPVNEVFDEYITEMIKGIRTGLFNVIGHADLIKRPGQSLVRAVPHLITEMLEEIRSAGMAIELNSSGYRREISECYPGFDWLDMIKKHQIPVTTGSDAHQPSQIALNFDTVYNRLKHSGFETVTGFREGKQYPVVLT